MDKNICISVVVATYNGADYIRDQISSILRQLGKDDELIVTDDNSTDSTIPIVRIFSDARIKVIYSDGLKGPIGNFENGIKCATKDVVVLSDQDDVWLDGRIDVIRSAFKRSKSKYFLVVLNSSAVNKELEVIHPSVFEFMHSGKGIFKNIYRNTYIGCHMAFSRSLVSLVIPFPKRIPMHDVWIGLISELVGEVKFIDSITMLFRRTGNNFTKVAYPWKTRIFWRINLILRLAIFTISNFKAILIKR